MENVARVEKDIESLLGHYELDLERGNEAQINQTRVAIFALANCLPGNQQHLPFKKLTLCELRQQKKLLINKLQKSPADYTSIIQLSEKIGVLYAEICESHRLLRNERKNAFSAKKISKIQDQLTA